MAQGNPYDQTFWYDGANRLCEAAEATSAIGLSSCTTTVAPAGATWWQTHVYDAVGNRALLAGGYGTSGSSQAQVSSVSASAVAAVFPNNQWAGAVPDAGGNLTTLNAGGAQPTYDAENRIQSVTESTMPAIAYAYDGEGRRVQKTVGSVTTDYVYDATGALAAEYGGNAPVLAPTVFLMADWLGSTRMETNSGGGVVALMDYAPFGEQLPMGVGTRGSLYGTASYPSVTANAVEPDFTGKERDAESGLDYFGARYFSSAQGRFTSPDPFTVTPGRVMDPQQLNLYAYVRNNPLKHVDPTGMVIDDSACEADKNCAKSWQQVQNIANQQDKNGNYLHPELRNVLSALQGDSRTFALENSKLSQGVAGLFTITNFSADGKDFTRATLQLDFKKIQGVSGVTAADLVPGFNKYQGLLSAPIDRLAETFGHEGAHGLFSIENPAQAVGIQQTLNDRDAAMRGVRYPYPPDIMQKIEAADKALIPTEKFAQQEEKIINGELQADRKEQ